MIAATSASVMTTFERMAVCSTTGKRVGTLFSLPRDAGSKLAGNFVTRSIAKICYQE
jgi:hypothetical protein